MRKKNDTKRQDTSRRFSNWLFFVIIPLGIVGMLLVKTIVFYHITESITDIAGLESYLQDTNLLDLGIGIISIAISVWLGINITNLVDRKDIENIKVDQKNIDEKNIIIAKKQKEFKKNIKKIKKNNKFIKEKQKKLIESIDNISNKAETDYFKAKLLFLLSDTIGRYEISKYLYDNIKNNSDLCSCFELEVMSDIEQEFLLCVGAYEKNQWEDTFKYAKLVLDKIEVSNLTNVYSQIRKADVLFYMNVAKTHSNNLGDFSEEEMVESVRIYREIFSCLQLQDIDKKIIGYLHNTIGYTYDLLFVNTKNQDYITKSLKHMSLAVEDNPKGRYYRNQGLAFQHSGDLNNALKCYKIAVRLDLKDFKAYNNILSITLKEIDKISEVNKREENGKLIFQLDVSNVKDQIKMNLDEIIDNAEFALETGYWFEDIHFNMCKAYMYYYIVCDNNKDQYMKSALAEGKKALHINPESPGAHYSMRNAYECFGQKSEAVLMNEWLVAKKLGDSIKIRKLYDQWKEE